MNQSLYNFFVRRKSTFSYFLTFSIFALFLFAWIKFIYSEEQKKILNYQTEIATLRKRARMISKKVGDEKKEKKMAVALAIDNQDLSIYASYDVNQAIDFFLAKATKIGLRTVNCITQGEKKNNLYCVRPVLLKFLGSFDLISSFFEQINSSAYLVKSGPLFMNKGENDQISIDCVLNFYQFN